MAASDVLRRVSWQQGQILRPAHFRALEDSLAAEAALRAQAGGLPSHGVLELAWNGDAPANGVVAVTRLRWLATDGQLVDLPGNARLDGTLSLKGAKAPFVEVYLHRLDEPVVLRGEDGTPTPGESVHRTVTRLALSTERVVVGSSRSPLMLGAFRRLSDWTLEKESSPPLLSLRNTPYLLADLADVRAEVARAETALREGDLSPELRGDERFVRTRARFALRHARDLLADLLDGEVDLHPYPVFAALRELSRELEAMGNLPVPSSQPFVYSHAEPGVCFGAVLRLLMAQLTTPVPATDLYRFECEATDRGVVFQLRGLPAAPFQPGVDAYVLVHRARLGVDVSLEGASLTAPDRVRTTVGHRRTPLGLVPVQDGAVTRRFGDWIQVFRVEHAGRHAQEAWAEAAKQRALALVDHELDAGVSLFLYWQQGAAAAAAQERAT